MKNELPENIQKLLKSSVIEDVIIGVEWCILNKGEGWARNNFIGSRWSGCSKRTEPKFSTINLRESGGVSYDDFNILIGTMFIQYDGDISYVQKIINNKTK